MNYSFSLFLLFFFLATSCSRIGFQDSSAPSRSHANHTVDSSVACEADPSSELCKDLQEDRTHKSFFRKGREETRPGYLTEYFEISHREELEIVIVLDVSRSMDDNLKKTGQNMMSLLSHIQHRKWRISFMTADHGDHYTLSGRHDEVYPQEKWEDYQDSYPRFGKFMRLEKQGKELDQFILEYNTPQYAQIFKDTLTREASSNCHKAPYCQGANEQPLRSLQSAFLRYTTDHAQQQFFQANTDTIVIIITDEDERRQDVRNATKASEVIATFKKVFEGQRKRLFGFSISIQDEKCYKKEGRHAIYGRRVGRLADLTLGKNVFASQQTRSGNISLCSKDYGRALADISQITRTVTESLTLEKIFYIPETVDIQLDPAQPQVSWRFYGRKLVFSQNILPGTKVRVSYRYEQNTPKGI